MKGKTASPKEGPVCNVCMSWLQRDGLAEEREPSHLRMLCTLLLPIGSGLSANNCGQVGRNVVAQVLTTCVSRRACLLDTHASTVGYARQMHTHTRCM